MRFRNENKLSKINLEYSYNNNYKALFSDIKGENGIQTFNNIPIFKYEKLILKYDKMPTQDEIKKDIQSFLNKVRNGREFKVFSIKGNKVKDHNKQNIYIVNTAFICFM